MRASNRFFKSYGWALLLLLCLSGGYYFFYGYGPRLRIQQYWEVTHAVKYGTVLRGEITQYESYRSGFVGKQGFVSDEGAHVAIKCELGPGAHLTFFENWPMRDNAPDADMKGRSVGVYYYPQNRYLKAVSFNHPDVQGMKTKGR